MTYAQTTLFLWCALPFILAFFYAFDKFGAWLDDRLTREKIWREIEVRSCRERHPSSQAVVFDWAKETEGELFNDGETWFDCDREGHEEGCYMTRDESGDVKYRDCEVKEETSTN